ncbi:MAG: acyltransferase [Burkholderiaceae bacterium]
MKATPSKNQTSDQRLESIQVLRGIAALLVVFCHQIYVGHDHLPPNGWLYWLFESATPIGAFGVDLFFVISGFVMLFSVEKLHGASSAGQFLVGRALRILPIYYLVAGTLFLRGLQAGTDFGAVGFVNSFLLLPLTDQDAYNWPVLIVGWTLVFEFIFYLVVAAVVVADVRQRAATIVGITIALPLLGLSLGLEHASAVIVRMIANPILIEFSLGALAYIAWRKGLIERHRATWQLLALVALVSVPLTLSMRNGGVANADELIDGGIGWLRTIGWGSSAALVFLAILTVRSTNGSRAIAPCWCWATFPIRSTWFICPSSRSSPARRRPAFQPCSPPRSRCWRRSSPG